MRAHRPLYTWFLRGGLGFLFVLGQLPLRAGGPTIIQQPTPQSVFQGDTASFMVQAIGVNPTYQWKFNGGAINGATNDTLVLNNVQGTQAGEYKVDVRDPSGTTTSSKVNLTVYVPPTITSQPLDLTKNQGQSGSLSVAATGTSPLSYQWFFQNLPIPNATGQILSLSGLQGSQTGSYFAVASNLAGMATSRVATVTVIVPPSILQQPLAQTATLGSAVEFSVMAAGTAPFSYQWKFNGGKITDATNALLRIPNATPAVAGKYRVDISNPAGDVTSAEVNLTVDSTPPPPMDLVWTNLLGGIWGDAANWSPNRVPSFATDRAFIQAPGGYVVSLDAGVVLDRLTLGGGNETPTLIVSGPTLTLSGDSSIAPGAGLVLTAGTLNGAGSLTVGGTLNWQSGVIAKPVSVASEGQVTLSSSSTKVLQGASLINDGIVTWTDGGNFELTSGSALENNGTFAWLNNLEFKQGGGASSTLVNRGTLRKTVGSGTSKLKDIRLINSGTIEVQTGVLEISSGAAHVFGDGTTTRGAGTLYLNGVNVSAAGSFHHFGVLEFKSGTMVWTNSPSLNGTSTFLINGGKLYLDGEFPFQAPLELTSGTISSLVPGSVTLRGNLNWLGGNFEGNVVVGADGSLLLGGSQNKKLNDATLQNLGVMSYAGTGDLQATSASSLVNRGQFTFMNSGTLKQSGNGIAPLFDNSGSVGFGNAPTRINMEYAFNQSANGTLSLGLGGSTTNDIDQLLLSTNAVFNGTLNVTLRNGFSPAQGDQFDVIAYARRSGTFAQLTGESFKLVPDYRGSGLRLKAETLSFVSQPGNQTVTVLNPVTITGEVNGHGLLQWHFNNSPIPGATNPTLSIGSALPTHAGTYQLLASNHWGSTASRAVTLTVFSPLTQTSQPQSQTVVAGSNVSFSVGASSVAPIQYQWKFNGSAIAGATNATLTLASVTSAHAGKYKVEVGNGSQNFTSAEAILTVNVPVTITSPPASRAVITDDSTSFNVSVAGTPPFTYQWLFNGNPLPGANGDKLDLSHIVPAQAGAYAVMVSNVVGAVLSTSATLTVNVPAGIAVPPQNQSVTAGNSATFTVVPSGTPPFTYQWKFNNSTLPGATNASLVLNGVQTAQAGTYSVFVGNPFGPTVNAGAMLTVNVPVAIIQQPVSQDAVPGETATFFVAATGTPPISYQWRWNGTPIAGASQPMLTLTNVDTVIGGDYSVVVSNIAGAETSDTARLAVATNLRQAWVTRHNGTDNHHDGFRSAVMDPAGNVYVTGWSDEQDRDNDFVTIKYNAAGTRVWLAHYNGPDNSDDQAQAIGLDAAGNVVVTGFSKGVGSGFDYATVKYDPAGNQLWVARYNGPSNKDDLAHALALDATGNIHVTGASKGPGDTFHYGTVKYAPDGQQLWVARHVGTGNSEDQARAIAVDSAGNVIVTGKSKGVGSNFDYATVKYNAAGAQLWAARYNGPGNDVDEATAVAVDASGEVYVAGTSKGPGTDHDFATIKYDATGVMAWVTRYNGPVNKEDQATGMALDSQGRVLIIGASKGPGGNLDYLTQCLNPAGAQLWIARYNGPDDSDDLPSQVRVDAADEVYVTGGSKGPGTSLDFATIKYNQDGQKEWVARYNGTGNGDDIGRALVIDAENSVYVVGESKGSGTDLDAAIVKYTQPRPPAILVQPRSQSAPLLGPVFFNVLATGTGPLVYQWQLNGANIPGATNATLVIPSATVAANGNYQVTVSNPAGAVESEVAQLTITLPLVDFSDTFGAGLPNATLAGVGVGGNVGATVQPGEPNHGGKVGGHSVWFTWRAPASGVVTFSTAGSGFDTLLAAYQGNAVNGLTLVAGDDDSGGFLTSRISFNAQVGEVYHIAVDGLKGATGQVVLSWNLEITNERLPVIASLTDGMTIGFGESATLSVSAANTGVTYQWFLNGVALAGAQSSVWNIVNATVEDVGIYYVRVQLGTREILSRPVPVQINRTDGTVVRTARATDKFGELIPVTGVVVEQAGQVSESRKLVKGGTSRSGDRYRAAGTSRGYTGTQVFTTYSSGSEPDEPTIDGTPGGASAWFAWQAPINGTLHINTDGSDFDTLLGVYTGDGSSFESLKLVASDNNSGIDGRDSAVRFPAAAGTTYYIAVDGVGGASGRVVLNYNLGDPPAIVDPPQSQLVQTGSSVVFSASHTGTETLQYQWRFNGVKITGATNWYLVIENAQATKAGSYSVKISNPVDTVTSPSAQLTLLSATINISAQPQNQTVPEGATAQLEVIASGSPALAYQWRFDGLPLTGETNATLQIPDASAEHEGLYSVLLTDANGSRESAMASLTVSRGPVINSSPTSQLVPLHGNATLSVGALGGQPLRYQWQRNGQDLVGATNDTLVIADFQGANEGSYRAVVNNSTGSAISGNAVLAVQGSPRILASGPNPDGSFRLQLVVAPNTTYTLEASENLVDWRQIAQVSSPSWLLIFDDPNASLHPICFYRFR